MFASRSLHLFLPLASLLTACTSVPERNTLTGPPMSATFAAPSTSFSCVQNFASRPYAFYAASATLTTGGLVTAVVSRPYIGDTLSTRAAATLVPPTSYPGFSSYNVWDVTGGPASGTTDLYYLLLPKQLPPLGGAFRGEVHVLFDGGNLGWIQSTQDCIVTAGGSDPDVRLTAPISCIDPSPSRPYAFYAVTSNVVKGVPTSNVVSRPSIGDVVSQRATGVALSPTRYLGWPQHRIWNITGGAAMTSNDSYYLLLPKVLPVTPGATFQAELHVQFNDGRNGMIQSLQDCTVL